MISAFEISASRQGGGCGSLRIAITADKSVRTLPPIFDAAAGYRRLARSPAAIPRCSPVSGADAASASDTSANGNSFAPVDRS